MAIDKFTKEIDGVEQEAFNFSFDTDGLSEGAHTITIKAYEGATQVLSETRNITINSASVDPDYQAVLDYATANSIPLPDSTQQSEDDQLIKDIKAIGAWAEMDTFANFGGTADPSFKLICWKRRVQMVAFGSLTWDAEGVEGNGTNAYIDSLFIPSSDGVNFTASNAGIVASFKKGVKTNGIITGAQSGPDSGGPVRWSPNAEGSTTFLTINAAASTTTNDFTHIGLNSLNRLTSSTAIVKGAVDYNYGIGTGVLPTNSLYILAGDNGASAGDPFGFSDEKIKHIAHGASFDTLHDSLKTILV